MYYKFHSVLSPAKLNLGLKIISKREDGYHNLKSIFCLINLCDKMDFQITNNGKISLIEHNQAWYYQKDLTYKAALLLQESTKTQLGANIKTKKVIPSGSGMGGGSSNAATALLVLNQLWKTNLNTQELALLGLKLGADVPFFIYGKNALVEGIGEKITPLELTQQYFVIIKPEFHIPTPEIFAHLNLLKINQKNLEIKNLNNNLENDLELVARQIYPELNQLFNELSSYGNPRLTGSGSACYFCFFDKNLAKNLANILCSRYNTYLAASLPKSTVACDW